MRFLFLLGLAPVQRFLLFFLEDRYDIRDPMAAAALFILLAILVASVGGLVAGFLDQRLHARVLLASSVVAGSAGLLGVAVAPTAPLAGVAGLLLAFAAGSFMAANWALLSRTMPDEEPARFFGLANVATAGASALAGAMGPVVDLGTRFMPGETYQVLFGLCCLVSLSALLAVRSLPAGTATTAKDRPRATPTRSRLRHAPGRR
jgi:MFS family permease